MKYLQTAVTSIYKLYNTMYVHTQKMIKVLCISLTYISCTSCLNHATKDFFTVSVLITALFMASPGGNKCTSTYGSGKPVHTLHNKLRIAITYSPYACMHKCNYSQIHGKN